MITNKAVICVNTGEIFDSVNEAGRIFKINPSNISAACKGKRMSAGKLNGEPILWKYFVSAQDTILDRWSPLFKLQKIIDKLVEEGNVKELDLITETLQQLEEKLEIQLEVEIPDEELKF